MKSLTLTVFFLVFSVLVIVFYYFLYTRNKKKSLKGKVRSFPNNVFQDPYHLNIFNFRLEVYESKSNLTQAVPVQIQTYTNIEGFIKDGDVVEMFYNNRRPDGILEPIDVYNHSLKAQVIFKKNTTYSVFNNIMTIFFLVLWIIVAIAVIFGIIYVNQNH